MNPFKKGLIGTAYIVHARRFTDRAAQMKAQLDQRGIPFEFIQPYDADVLTAADLGLFSDAARPMARGQKSCTLKHVEALRRIAAGDRLGLIFEDDAILDPQFMDLLEKAVAESQSFTHLHVLYIGIGSNMFVPWRRLRRGRCLYEATESRCAEAYLIGPAAARARLAWLVNHKIDRPIDHLYTLMDREIGLQMYWSNPGVVEQGSMNGFYFTTQEVGSKLRRLWQLKLRFKVQRLRRKYIYRFFQ